MIIATALYNIIGFGRNSDYCDLLATALGSNAKKPANRKKFLLTIARDCFQKILNHKIIDDRASVTTSPTKALTQSTKSDTSMLSILRKGKAPPLIVNTNSSDDIINHLPTSPLTDRSNGTGNSFFERLDYSISKLKKAITPRKSRKFINEYIFLY